MKQDPKLVALKQKYEVYYIAHRYGISAQKVRGLIKMMGRSRKKIYARLKEEGFAVVHLN